MPTRPIARRHLAPIAIVPAVMAIVLVTWLVVQPSTSRSPAATVGASGTTTGAAVAPSSAGTVPSATGSATDSASGSASPSAVPAPGCTGDQMSGSVGKAGPAAGTENVFIVLQNTGQTACLLGGILPLTGVRADGATVPLPIDGSSDLAVIDPGPVTGSGPVAPGEYGTFHVTIGLNCSPSMGTFATLRIGLSGGSYVDMPYPQEFTLGCPGFEAPAGPIASLAALNIQ